MTFPGLRGRPDRPEVTLAAGVLGLGVLLLFLLSGRTIDLLGSTPRILLVVLWPLVLLAFWLSRRISIPALYILAAGMLLRLWDFPPGGGGPSDVQAATNEAIAVLLGGGNPYTHVYEMTRPPGNPMPYPPGALLVHLPGHLAGGMQGVQMTQVLLAGAALVGFLWLGWAVSWLPAMPALAVYAAAPNLITLSLDGSNDTGVGALLMLALIALMLALDRPADRRLLVAAALVGALVVATKQSAGPIIGLVVLYVWRTLPRPAAVAYAGTVIAFLVAISVPFLLLDAGAYVGRLGGFLGAHEDIYGWNIWTMARGLGWQVWEIGPATTLNLLASVIAIGLAVALPIRRLSGAVTAGVIVTLAMLLTARWTTYAYFALLAPVVVMLPAIVVWEARRRLAGMPAGAAPSVAPPPVAAPLTRAGG